MHNHLAVAAAACVIFFAACSSPEEIRDAVEDELFQSLECEDMARPSTLARVRAALDAPSADTFGALATDPADLATVVSFAGAEVEGVMLAANMLNVVSQSDVVQELLAGGWDGVQCGEDVPLGCTAGEQATVVHCDVRGEVTGIDVSFERCALQGTVLDGALQFKRLPRDDVHASLLITQLSIDEAKFLDGTVRVDIAHDGAFVANGAAALLEHGGFDGGLECGATLAANAFAMELSSVGGRVVLDGVRDSADEHIALRGDIRYDTPVDGDGGCACPSPGSSLFVDVPRPLGIDGETAGATITWGECNATVELSDWPEDCFAAGDCAKEATKTVLSGVFSALCAKE